MSSVEKTNIEKKRPLMAHFWKKNAFEVGNICQSFDSLAFDTKRMMENCPRQRNIPKSTFHLYLTHADIFTLYLSYELLKYYFFLSHSLNVSFTHTHSLLSYFLFLFLCLSILLCVFLSMSIFQYYFFLSVSIFFLSHNLNVCFSLSLICYFLFLFLSLFILPPLGVYLFMSIFQFLFLFLS